MRKFLPVIVAGALALASCSSETSITPVASSSSSPSSTTSQGSASSSTNSATSSSTAATIEATTEAANNFLATLNETQREQVSYAFDDETKATSWSNFPVTFVERSGLKLGDLTAEQQQAAMKVMEALLNDEAYTKITGIMAGDQYLADHANAADLGDTQYNIAFFGTPSTDGSWSIQFGGHHLGINATFENGSITFAPTHLGTQPTTYTDDNGVTQSALGGMYDTAFAFYDSLDDAQRAALYQGSEVKAMQCEPGSSCDYPTGTGLKGSELSDAQKHLLLKVIANWVDLADEQTTNSELEAIEATLDETYINWSGATTYDTSQGEGIYLQISGPKVYIELASQHGSAGADVDGVITAGWGHIHTIYRDPTNDYGGAVEQQASSGPMGGPGGGMPAGVPPQRREQ